MGCQSHRTIRNQAHTILSSQLPFFKDAESLNRELGLLRMRQLEDVENISVLAELTAGFTLQAMMSDSKTISDHLNWPSSMEFLFTDI